MTLEERRKLNLALAPRQPKVHIEYVDDAIDLLMANPELRVEYATLLTPSDGQVDVGRSH